MPNLSPRMRSVYILGDGSLFDEIIVHMLASDSNLRVIKQVYGDEAAFLTDVSWYQPDVIVLNETDLFSCKQILALLSTISLTADMRVIAMSVHNKDIQVFDHAAGQRNRHVSVPHIITGITNWNKLIDLVGGGAFS